MSREGKDRRSRAHLLKETANLRLRLEEAEQTLEAIRNGDVDALVVSSPRGERIYSVTGAEYVYRVIVETMNEAALTVDRDGTILFCNQRFCELMKTPLQQALGRRLAIFAALPQQPTLQAILRDAQNEALRRRVTLRAADGTVVPVQISAGPLPADDTVNVCLVASDLTELEASANSIRVLREHQQALEDSEERFRTMADNISQLAWMADETGRIFWYNRRWYEYTGIAAHEIEGWGWGRAQHSEHAARVAEKLGRCFETGEAWEDMFPLRGADGSYRWFLSRATPIRDSRGAVVRWFGTSTDFTEQRAAQEALQQLNATLEGKVAQRTGELEYRARQLQKLAQELSGTEDRERKRIAEILHDDVQQILAAAKFHLGSIQNRARYDPSIRATATQIDHMLTEAIEKARALSRELSPVLPHNGDLGDALGWLASQTQAKHGLLTRVDARGKVQLRSDALRSFLYKATRELLFNVVKHARTSEARIRIRRLGRCICLSVSDRGQGFDPRDLRATAGFGLFNIRERIDLLGGRMRIRSVRGLGSVFHIVVPDSDSAGNGLSASREPEERAADGAAAGDRVQRRLRVLIADDHEIVRDGLSSLLRDEDDVQVVGEAENGREAVDLADRLQPDVIIMDVAMPLIDGDEATRQIKRHMPGTRVIALSMYDGHENVEKMLAAGAEIYILKTASANELLAAIRGTAPRA